MEDNRTWSFVPELLPASGVILEDNNFSTKFPRLG